MRGAVGVLAPTACLLMLIPAASWQRQLSALMGIEGPTNPGYLRTLAVAAVVGALLVSAFRVLLDIVKLLARILIRRCHLHAEVALHIAPDVQGRLRVLVHELERPGAFTRKVLIIAPTTGTGWIDPVAASSVETMYNGDTAIVGAQCSYLPSWISFLADRQKSMDSGRMLINAVHDRWEQLSPDHRPKLVLYGESLGSMAGQAPLGG